MIEWYSSFWFSIPVWLRVAIMIVVFGISILYLVRVWKIIAPMMKEDKEDNKEGSNRITTAQLMPVLSGGIIVIVLLLYTFNPPFVEQAKVYENSEQTNTSEVVSVENKGGGITVDTKDGEIRYFTQSVAQEFANGTSLEDTVKQLKEGDTIKYTTTDYAEIGVLDKKEDIDNGNIEVTKQLRELELVNR